MTENGGANLMMMSGNVPAPSNFAAQTPIGGAQPLTSFQRRQMDRQKNQDDANLSIEDRLARLKQIHQKPQLPTRPASGNRMQQMRTQVQRQSTGPLAPSDFQAELDKRTAEEREKMEQFKAHEEKMKAFREAKKTGQKPPLVGGGEARVLKNQSSVMKLPDQPRNNKTQLRIQKAKSIQRRSSGTNVNAHSSQSTTANTYENQLTDHPSPESELGEAEQAAINACPPFLIENETGQKGAKPESNIILDLEVNLVDQKRDKLYEVFKSSSEVHSLVTSSTYNPRNLELHEIVDMLFDNQHFRNLLGDLLTKRASTAKLEKFFATQVKSKLAEISTELRIESTFNSLAQRMQARLDRLKNTQFNPQPDNENP